MKKILVVLLLMIICAVVKGQSGMPYAVWEDPNTSTYYVVTLDAATGVKTNLCPVPGMSGFIAGNKTCYNSDMDLYHFAGLFSGMVRYCTYNVSSNSITSTVTLLDNIVGVEYHCGDSTYYCIREQFNNYELVTFDPLASTFTIIASLPGVTAYIGHSFALDRIKGQYFFIGIYNGGVHVLGYDIASGANLIAKPLNDNLTAFRYSCADSTIYSLWENGSVYQLEMIDTNTGAHSLVAPLAGVTPGFVGESISANDNGIYTYRGFDASNQYALISIDLQTGAINSIVNTNDNAVGFEEPMCCFDSTMSVGTLVLDNKNRIKIYPNPCKDKLFVEFYEDSAIIEVELYNRLGQLVLKQELKATSSTTINLEGLNSGLYTLRVKQNLYYTTHLVNIIY